MFAVSSRVLTLVLVAGTALSATAADSARSITIYSSAQPGAIDPSLYRPVRTGAYYNPYQQQQIPGYAVVREDRKVNIANGRGELRITDVAALIDPTTVSFRSLTDPVNTRVIDQNFQFDLVSTEKLMQKYVDHQISVVAPRGDGVEVIDGTLLSSQNGGFVLKNDKTGQIHTLASSYGVTLPELPSGLITRPTLVWNTASNTGGEQTARISYQTEGITWWADYNLVYTEGTNANKGVLDVGAWVSILNQSGASYEDTRLKLVAGQVQRAPRQNQGRVANYARSEMAMDAAAAPEFSEKSFFEYHLYTLSEPTSIPENSTKQLELFPTARGVPCDKVLVYIGQDYNGYWYGEPMTNQDYGIPTKKDVDVYLRFDNKEGNGLGIPLPSGRVRVSKLDEADGGLEFIGEDVIKHTPRNEEILIRLGQSFDVVGERKQVDFNYDASRKRMDETIEVEVRNRKKEPVQVIIQERMYRWTNWQFVGQVPDNKKLDATTVQFPVTIEPDGKAVVKYTVRYSW